MPNGTYGGVRGKGAKAKTLAPRPTRFAPWAGRAGLTGRAGRAGENGCTVNRAGGMCSAVQYVALTTPRTWTGRRTVVGLVRGKKREKKKNVFKGLFAPKNSYNFVD